MSLTKWNSISLRFPISIALESNESKDFLGDPLIGNTLPIYTVPAIVFLLILFNNNESIVDCEIRECDNDTNGKTE